MPSRIIYGAKYKDLEIKLIKGGRNKSGSIYEGVVWWRAEKLKRIPPGYYPFTDKDYWRVTWSFRKKRK